MKIIARTPQYLTILVAIASLILLAASSLRHFLLQSSALDLAAFDQWVYLLSQDLPPISSFFGVHVLGDHAAFILYPISLLYRIKADVHWLLLIQAIALAMGSIPLYTLSRHYGLPNLEARTIALCYILYPAVFNSNFYADFRPEALAVPGLLWAMQSGITGKSWQLAMAIALVLSCKERLGLTVVALGVWFLCGEGRRVYGWGCMVAGVLWCIFTMGYLIPSLRSGNPSGLEFYSSLGSSSSEIALNLLKNPALLFERLFLGDRIGYCLLLVAPVILGLHWKAIANLIPALPMLLLNLLSDYAPQRDLIHHYSLPIFPFIMVWLVRSLALYRKHQQRQWLKPKWLIVWAAIAFLALGKYDYFFTRYLSHLSNLPSVYAALSQVPDRGSVLTEAHLAPHLSHRAIVHLISNSLLTPAQLNEYDYVLLDTQHPDKLQPETLPALKEQSQSATNFQLTYSQNDVFLFKKRLGTT